jgi:hypothetical protein
MNTFNKKQNKKHNNSSALTAKYLARGTWFPKEKLDCVYTIIIVKAFEPHITLCTIDNITGRNTIGELKQKIYEKTCIGSYYQKLNCGLWYNDKLICDIPGWERDNNESKKLRFHLNLINVESN